MPDVVERILFVCTANVCRSPTAQALALKRLRAEGLSGGLRVVSAGTRAAEGRGWCPEARKHVADPETRGLMDGHQPHQLSRSGIEKATMVVTADRQASAEVVHLEPSVRSRLFTMREAAALSTCVVEALGVPARRATAGSPLEVSPFDGADGADDPESRLQWLVREMDAARGQVSLLTERRHRHWFRIERITVLDIDVPDAHAKSGRGNHRRIMPELTGAVDQLMAGVTYVLKRPAA
jgi:protein-tyrosine-phosphatase